jgi:DNA polymerase-3 subunit epsilon
MKLSRPVAFFDLETTGVSTSKDRIVEIAITKIDVNFKVVQEFHTLVNPTVPIPEGASNVHGISDEDVSDQDVFGGIIAEGVLEFIDGCDLAGYYVIKFDVPLLLEEFFRAGITWNYKSHKIIDIFKILKVLEPRTLSGTYKRFTGRNLEDAHSAQADNKATLEIFKRFNEIFAEQLPETSDDIGDIKFDGETESLDLAGKFKKKDNQLVFSFGKYKDKTVQEVFQQDSNYFLWISDKADFPAETKRYAKQLHSKLSQTVLHQ